MLAKVKTKIIGIVICLMLMIVCCSCTNQLKSAAVEKDIWIDNTSVFSYGNYIYYLYSGMVTRYHIPTGEFSSACVDPFCGHAVSDKCPMWGIDKISFIANDCLFYTRFSGYNDDYRTLESYNLLDGTVRVLKVFSKYEVGLRKPKTDGKYVYYQYQILKPGGDSKNPDDYCWEMFRQPLTGGEEERLFPTENKYGNLLFVTDNQMYFMPNGCEIMVTDLAGEQMRTLFAREDCFSIDCVYMYDGFLYFLGANGSYDVAANGVKIAHWVMYRVDVNSGETEQLLDDYVSTFSIDGNNIYYLLYDLKTLYDPTDFGETGVPVVYTVDYTWRSINLNGENMREIFTEEYTSRGSGSASRVIDGVLYGRVSSYDPQTHKYGDTFWSTVDVESGTSLIIANLSQMIQEGNQ